MYTRCIRQIPENYYIVLIIILLLVFKRHYLSTCNSELWIAINKSLLGKCLSFHHHHCFTTTVFNRVICLSNPSAFIQIPFNIHHGITMKRNLSHLRYNDRLRASAKSRFSFVARCTNGESCGDTDMNYVCEITLTRVSNKAETKFF